MMIQSNPKVKYGESQGRNDPIPTYSITKEFDWSDTENNELLFEMAAKYGTPYFSNYVNSDMKPSDIRSMAIMPWQVLLVGVKKEGSEERELQTICVQNLYHMYQAAEDKDMYRIFYRGEYLPMTEMFQIDYTKYDTFYKFTLDRKTDFHLLNEQMFSYDHKCVIVRGDTVMECLAQDVQVGDYFLVDDKVTYSGVDDFKEESLHNILDTSIKDSEYFKDELSKSRDWYLVKISDITVMTASHLKDHVDGTCYNPHDYNVNYVYNFTVDTNDHLYTLPNGVVTHQCCRLRLDLTELRRKNGGFFGSGESTGSVGVVTINLPRLAYESENVEEFYEKLDHVMDIAARSLDIKRKVITKLLNAGFYPYTKRYLGGFDNHFSTIGLVGMNEAGLNAKWIQAGMDDERTQKWAEELLNHMRDRLIIYQQEYGALFNLESTPAESTSYRFAKHDKERYPDIKTANDSGTPYYTNSTNLPVGYTADVFDALDIQDPLQVLYTSGTVFHTYLGEKLPNWKSAANLVKTITDNYHLPYITLSPTYSICKNHGYLTGEIVRCPDCGGETEVYSRITGYYRPIKNWNDGKAQEFKDRQEYTPDKYPYTEKGHGAVKPDSSKEVPSYLNENLAETEVTEEDFSKIDHDNNGYLLFTNNHCPNCKIVENYMNENQIPYQEMSVDTDDGMALAKSFNIMSVPTLVDMGVNDVHVINGVTDTLAYLKKIQ